MIKEIKYWIKIVLSMIRSLLYKILWIFRVNNKKIVIISFYGKGYGDSARYIVEELISRKNKYDIVWLSRKKTKLPRGVRNVKYGTIRADYELATSKLWIDNSRKKLYVTKRKNQLYLQTWHSNLRIKKIEKDGEAFLTKYYIKCAKNDSKMADAMIAGCDFGYNTIRNSFWYDGPIYKTGIPRCDELFNIDSREIKKTKEKLGVRAEEKVFLYAPTFRKNGEIDLSKISNLTKKLDAAYGNNYKLLVRFHPISKQTIRETKSIMNATSYPNMQELINAADILITDYSGSMFDAIIAHKPCILFTPDFEDYIKKERELYFDFSELPFVNTHTFDELGDAIVLFDKKDYNEKANSFLKKIGCYEKGESAKNVADLVEKLMNS